MIMNKRNKQKRGKKEKKRKLQKYEKMENTDVGKRRGKKKTDRRHSGREDN